MALNSQSNNGSSGSRTARSTSEVDITSRIKKKDAIIGVVGLGQVGLPTALSFIKAGYSIVGYDTNARLVSDLSRGITTVPEDGVKNLLITGLSKGKILFGSSSRSLINADVIIVCVPTPLSAELSADLSYLSKAVTEIASNCMKSKKLLVIESSIPPMTMSGLIIPTLEKCAAKRLGTDFLLAFCPERLSPGQALSEISDAVRVIGVSDDQSFEAAKALYSNLTDAEILKSNFETTEISKLAENAFRDVNIAFANELAMVCQDYDVDVKEVINIANTHHRVKILNPGPGVGGPCLPKDPYLLIHKSSSISTSLIRKARLVNDSMPAYLVDILVRKLQKIASDTTKDKLKIGILGVTYKPYVNDYQNSPTERIISELTKRGYQDITVHDSICVESFGKRYSSDLKSLVKVSDCIIISTGHEIYNSLLPDDFKQSCIILDAARILRKTDFIESEHIHYIAPGLDN